MRPFKLSQPKAFTLIEVVASLLLVGALLATVLVGHRRAVLQIKAAERRLEAVELLDNLLVAREAGAPEFQEPVGKHPGDNPYFWRTEIVYSPDAAAVGAALLRFELFDPEYQQGDSLATAALVTPGDSQEMESRP